MLLESDNAQHYQLSMLHEADNAQHNQVELYCLMQITHNVAKSVRVMMLQLG
jgi:hypothetical protein